MPPKCCPRSLRNRVHSTVQDMIELSRTVESELGFLKTQDNIWVAYDVFNICLLFSTYFYFQGSHILAVLAFQ